MPKLSKRLQTIANLVVKDSIIFDVGSDHALLPIHLIKHEISNLAYASDINKGPFKKAKENIKKYEVSNKVIPLLGAGITFLPQEVDFIVIAGMGGTLIRDILLNDLEKLKQVKYLLLAPNNNESVVRKLLMNNNFEIIKEAIVKENNHYYEVILAKKTSNQTLYNKKELFFGPINLKKKDKFFIEKWTKKEVKISKIIKQIKTPSLKEKKLKQLNYNLIKDVLNDKN